MEEHGLKQTDLEPLVDQSTLSQTRRGEGSISKRLAERFRVSPGVFIDSEC